MQQQTPKCECCGKPQTLHGVQKFRLVEVDLYHCVDPECKEWMMTRCFNRRTRAVATKED